MNKKTKITDGKLLVGVILHNDYGAGWYTCHQNEQLLFDPVLIDMIEEKKSRDEMMKYCLDNYDKDEYYGSCHALEVVWVPAGTEFHVREYDGLEHLVLHEKMKWIEA